MLYVYYGEGERWNYSLLASIKKKLRKRCIGFDGLQADFRYTNRDEAIAALFIVRGMNIKAQVGNLGQEPSQQALDEAQAIMQETYKSEHEKY